ncbi:Gfo/Idh/MocA family protein [Lederbergia citrea]|uniref:Gfo/Idh/MocA family protein n=1 Tax=Lederbergia citrea TaxID=2833581 RepID=UPI001BCA04B7|nr:Gfo/Idh/MocA family oxidoreductase [Lederbergia citrea]MBS4179444.1 Gfo/Idh/MocA family oxidoreductase [Lederbergia citrea]
MINVALLSRWHVHADDYARNAQDNSNISIQLVWDEEAERGRKWAEELGVTFEESLEAVLSNPAIDAVIVNTPTNLHKKVIIAAAKHKKHIFSEKVLAFSVEDCNEIYDAVEENGVHLMLSLPRLTESYYLYAQEALDSGKLGKLTTIRCRMAHNGAVVREGEESGWLPDRFYNKEQAGGGALIDLGAHPIYLTNRLAGQAHSVQATLQQTNGLGVDDNAVVLVDYKSGALGIIETGFLSHGSPFQLELYGTAGTLLIEDGRIRITSSKFEESGWQTPENPEALPMPMNQWATAIINGTIPSITKDDAIRLTLINEAAALSHQEGKRINLKDVSSIVQNI